MKRSSLISPSLLVIMLLISHFASAQGQRWRKVSLDDSASVDFPGQVTRKEMKGQQVVFFNDDKARYVFIIGKNAYDGNPIDSELAKIYAETWQGALERLGECKLVQCRKFTLDGFSGMEVQYTAPTPRSLPQFQFMRFLLANGTFYSASFLTNNEHDTETDANRLRFFSSFRTGVKKTPPVDPETQTQAYKLGQLLGSLFVYGGLIAIVVVVIRRVSRPKQPA